MATETSENGTQGKPLPEQAVPGTVVPAQREESSSRAEPLKTGRTVPSPVTGPSNWLRYTPREPASGSCETSTET